MLDIALKEHPGISVRRLTESRWLALSLILLVLVLSRGVRVWELGVYWDDWRILARGAEGGANAIFRYLAGERLLMGTSHALLYALFGATPIAWHITNLLLEFGIAMLAYMLLGRLLRNYSLVPLLAACLFIAYPMSVIRTHMIQVYINLAVFLAALSLYLTSHQLVRKEYGRRSKTSLTVTALAVFLVPVYLLTYELPVGFEAIRLYILFAAVSRSFDGYPPVRLRLLLVLKSYMPYTIGLLVFVLGRSIAQPRFAKAWGADLREGMGVGILGRPDVTKGLESFFHTLIAPWINAAGTLGRIEQSTWTQAFAWLFALTAFIAVVTWALQRCRDVTQSSCAEDWNETRDWVRLCLVSVPPFCACLVLLWMHPLQTVSYQNLNSRNGYVATAVAPAICLGLIGCITSILFGKTSRQKAFALLAAVLIGVGVGHNFLLTDEWIKEWRHTQSTWQQILERIPEIKEDSLIVMAQPKDLKALSIPLRDRDIYEPAQLFYHLKYRKVLGSPVVRVAGDPSQEVASDRSIIPWLGTGKWEEKEAFPPVGPAGLVANRQRIIVLDESEGCLKAMDNKLRVQEVSSPVLNAISVFSNVDVIQRASADGDDRLRRLLLSGTERNWCYYYARACRLRQEKKWDEIAALYADVNRARLRPLNQVEWLPYIEGLDRSGLAGVADELMSLVRSGSAHCKSAVKAMLTDLCKEEQCSEAEGKDITRQIQLLSDG